MGSSVPMIPRPSVKSQVCSRVFDWRVSYEEFIYHSNSSHVSLLQQLYRAQQSFEAESQKNKSEQ